MMVLMMITRSRRPGAIVWGSVSSVGFTPGRGMIAFIEQSPEALSARCAGEMFLQRGKRIQV